MKKLWLISPFILMIALVIYFHFDLFSYLFEGDIESAQAYLSRNFMTMIALTFLIMLIQHSFTIFPLILVISINVLLYGFIPGFLWSWFASILASAIVFYAVRYLFGDLVVRKIPKAVLHSLDENGFMYVFQARIVPFIPTSLVNLAAGLSHIRFLPFILATTFGNFIFFLLLALVSEGILEATMEQLSLLGVAVVAFIIYMIMMWRKRKWKKKSSHAEL